MGTSWPYHQALIKIFIEKLFSKYLKRKLLENSHFKKTVYEFYMHRMATVLGRKSALRLKEKAVRATQPGVGCLSDESSSSDEDKMDEAE